MLQYEGVNGLLTFCKNNMFGENLVLELWSKDLKANQNAGFFKLEYLANKLRCEVEFLDVTTLKRGGRVGISKNLLKSVMNEKRDINV